MADGKLQDPDLPAGAIVATEAEDDALAEGQVRRNDGVVLNPAAKNPWYVLATIAGEHETTEVVAPDDDLAVRNRRFWNGWACAEMDDESRAELAEGLGVPVEELAPLTETERETLAAAFARRLGPDVPLPDPSGLIDCRATHFSRTVVWKKYAVPALLATFHSATFSGLAAFRSAIFLRAASFQYATFSGPVDFGFATICWHADFGAANFSEKAHFDSATFKGSTDFGSATFSGPVSSLAATFSGVADFHAVTFNGRAGFKSATFSELANFGGTTFGGLADFRSATFGENFRWTANFGSATFGGTAWFDSAIFHGPAKFSNRAFEAQTVFKDAWFRGEVPEFYQREFHQDTSFTTAESHWPTITPDIAEDGKRAYTRLRQLMLQLEKPDDAHFFFRQEMRCKEYVEDHWWNRVPITLFRWLSDYGYSVARPAAGLALAWLVPGFAYLFHFAAGIIAGTAPVSLLGPFGLSFANLFAFLGLHRLYFDDVLPGLPGGLQFLAGAQTVAGVVLLFFLGLGLRNRFRLH